MKWIFLILPKNYIGATSRACRGFIAFTVSLSPTADEIGNWGHYQLPYDDRVNVYDMN